MIKPYQITPFSKEKIKRLEKLALSKSIKELKDFYETNLVESKRCLATNEIINRVIKQKEIKK